MSRRYIPSRMRALVPALLLLLLAPARPAQAKSIGGETPATCPTCPTCARCPAPSVISQSSAGTSLSLTEGNLTEQVGISTTMSNTGPTVPVNATYNSYNADGSRAAVDTVMGYGWTHSWNIFLFSQLGAMFRYDGTGRVTKYGLGPGGTYIAAAGYFETLVKSGATYILTQKDKTTYTFASVPGNTLLVGGPVWMLTSVVDRNGNTTTLSYTSGKLTGVSDTYGRTTTFVYNGQSKVSTVTDPAGRVTTFQYDTTGHKLTSVTDPAGNSIHYAYNTLYQLTGKTDKSGHTFTYSYDAGFEPIAIQDSAGGAPATLSNPGNWATNAASLAANVLRVYTPATTTSVDGRGNVWKYQYDANGYLLQTVAPDGATTSATYDPTTLMLASKTDADGNTTTYQYDAEGNRLKTIDALGHATTYTYEPTYNMMTSMTDPRGRTTTFTYDGHGNRLTETDPLGNSRHWTYDGHGNALTDTDKDGHTTTYIYDADGDRIRMTDALGDVTTSTYDGVGNLLSRTDPNLHTTTYQYDGLNRPIAETDAAGNSTTTVYGGDGNRSQVTDRDNHTTRYQYDLRERVVTVTDALGHFDTYTYDGNDNRVTSTDRDGHTTGYAYDAQNRLNLTTDALGDTTSTTYDGAGNRLSATDADGHTTTYTYDAMNRRATSTDAASGITHYQYDTGTLAGCPLCGATPGSKLTTGRTDADGHVTYIKYDALDRQIDVVRKVGSVADTIVPGTDAVTVNTYDAVGNGLTVTEPDGNTTTTAYDADNRVVTQVNAAGDTTTTTYDAAGNVATVTSPNLDVTTNTYDSLNRPIQVSDSDGLLSTYSYDPVGNRLSYEDGNGNTTNYGYDAINRPVTTTDPLGQATTTTYDAVGNPLQSTDRDGNITSWTYDQINRRITATDALGETTQWQYDGVGNRVKLTDADSNVTRYTYDAVNRLVTEAYADGTTRSYTYDGVDNLLTRTDQAGRVTNYSYNDLYFLLGRTYPSAIDDTFTYDLSGRVLTALRGSWLVTFTYDGANRVTQAVENGKAIGYVYNIPGRSRALTYPGGRAITEYTDARGRMDHIYNSSTPPSIVQYSYDPGNRVVHQTYGNGTTAAYSYDADSRIVTLQHSTSVPAPIAGFAYAYDNEGNKLLESKAQDTTHSEAYQYDTTYRLLTYQVGTLSGSTVPSPDTQTNYSLDAVGNWTGTTNPVTSVSHTMVHNSINELTAIDATTLTYDADGNLLADGAYTYSYDEENRLVSITRDSDSAVVGQYLYDAPGRRVQKIADPAGVSSTTVYYYDDKRTIEEQTGGATQATYVYGNYVDEILTMDRGGQTYYYHRNALWSVEAVTDGSASAVERYAYDAYGSVAVSDGSFTPVAPNAWATPHSAIGNPWSFTGRQLDEEAGLYFYRARYYDAAEGRFLQVDPKWNFFDRQGDFRARSDPRARSRANLTAKSTDLAIPAADDDQYEYARDNPLRYTDPSGESYCVCTKPMPALPACTAVTPPGTVKNFSCAGTCQGLFGTGCPCTKLCTTTCKVKTTTVNAGVISFSTTSYAWEGGWDVPFNPTWHCEDDCGAILY